MAGPGSRTVQGLLIHAVTVDGKFSMILYSTVRDTVKGQQSRSLGRPRHITVISLYLLVQRIIGHTKLEVKAWVC
jgi:hypothetical protein